MTEIKELVKDIRHELKGADKYAYEAIKHKEEFPSLSQTYARIAREKLENVNDLHKEIVAMIDKARRAGTEIPAGMAAIWDFEHKMMIEEEAMIQHKLEMYKQ